MGEQAWRIAASYAVVVAAIALCGPGKLSLDHLRHGWTACRNSEHN
jgi:uncharacterized membrane protein YphA (DoxX/SURF4 family)